MKEMNNTEKFTDKEWEKLASILSGEEIGDQELVGRFLKEDFEKTGDKWKEIRDMSSERKIDVETAWQNVSSRISRSESKYSGNSRIFTMKRTLLRIAAVALILVSLGTGAFYIIYTGAFSKKMSFSTDSDRKNLLIELSDGSKIYLNRNSELTYLKDFGRAGRNVKLTGEAFFEITPDPSRPFIIDAGNAKIRVVGTSFNVITSNADSEVEVFVKTGKVLLSDAGNSKNIELDPGYVGKIDGSKAEKTVNNNPNYLSWKTGLLVYNGQTLDVVLKDLKRVYNMNIVTEDSTILANRWTSPIDNQDQETIIRLICVSFNLSYSQDGDVYYLVKK